MYVTPGQAGREHLAYWLEVSQSLCKLVMNSQLVTYSRLRRHAMHSCPPLPTCYVFSAALIGSRRVALYANESDIHVMSCSKAHSVHTSLYSTVINGCRRGFHRTTRHRRACLHYTKACVILLITHVYIRQWIDCCGRSLPLAHVMPCR